MVPRCHGPETPQQEQQKVAAQGAGSQQARQGAAADQERWAILACIHSFSPLKWQLSWQGSQAVCKAMGFLLQGHCLRRLLACLRCRGQAVHVLSCSHLLWLLTYSLCWLCTRQAGEATQESQGPGALLGGPGAAAAPNACFSACGEPSAGCTSDAVPPCSCGVRIYVGCKTKQLPLIGVRNCFCTQPDMLLPRPLQQVPIHAVCRLTPLLCC